MAALVLGDKSLLDTEIKQMYSDAGASHVLAVSGLHVGILVFVFNSLISFLITGNMFWRRFLRSTVVICFLWLYVWLVGGSPSVSRSALMFSFVSLSFVFQRPFSVYGALVVSAFVMMLCNPFVIFDVGFQLSYAAVISIIYFQPIIHSFFKQIKPQFLEISIPMVNRLLSNCESLLSVTLAAQIGTMPVVLYYFNQVSIVFWLSGLVVVPMVTIVVYSALLFLAFSWIPVLSSILACVLSFVVNVLNLATSLVASIPGACVDWIRFDRFDVLVYITSIVSIPLYIKSKNLRFVFMALIISSVFVVRSIVGFVDPIMNTVSVCSYTKLTTVNVYGADRNIVFCNPADSIHIYSSRKSLWIEERTVKPVFVSDPIMEIGGRTVFVLEKPCSSLDKEQAVRVDYLVVSNDVRVDTRKFDKILHCSKIIVDSSCSRSTAQWWRKHYSNVYVVNEDGDFVDKFM